MIQADQKIDGGPSVLYDAVAVLVSVKGADMIANEPAARDFVADAFAHSKFLGYSEEAKPFLSKVLGPDKLDDGFIAIGSAKDSSNSSRSVASYAFGIVKQVRLRSSHETGI